mgnify:CR=1 FL=1
MSTVATAARTGFDRATSREREDARGPHERVYANADGTETTEFSAAPVNYRTSDGAFDPIDTALTRTDDGWRNTTNAVGLALAAHADGEHRVELDDRHVFGYRLADAAARLSAAPERLVRTFTREFGLPPHRYLTGRRVDLARRLLLDGLPPALVAPAVGFYDQSHLTRHFRRMLGTPPGTYARSGPSRALRHP